MIRARTLALALVAVFAFGAVAAASASAFEWQINKKAIAKAKTIKSKGTLKLTDKKGGLFGEAVTIKCEGTDEGTVGPGVADTITKATATNCKTEAGTCPTPVASALHLPWGSKLTSATRDTITFGGKAQEEKKEAPGWKVTCSGIVEDECSAVTNVGIENVAKGVNAIFDASSPKANCSRGGAGQGEVLGTDLNENPGAGEQLEVH
jgi:hypothetical protein